MRTLQVSYFQTATRFDSKPVLELEHLLSFTTALKAAGRPQIVAHWLSPRESIITYCAWRLRVWHGRSELLDRRVVRLLMP